MSQVKQEKNSAIPSTKTKPTPELKADLCAECQKPLHGQFIQLGRKRYCFKCAEGKSTNW